MYPIYDVYNNAYRRGGSLNVTFDRYYIVDAMNISSLTTSIHHRKMKYDDRANMSDIIMQAVTIVSSIN